MKTSAGAPMGGSGESPLVSSDRVSQPRCRRASAEQEMDAIDDDEALDLLAAVNTDDDEGDEYDACSAASLRPNEGTFRTKGQATAAGTGNTPCHSRVSRGSRSSSGSLERNRVRSVRASYSELPELLGDIPATLPAAAIAARDGDGGEGQAEAPSHSPSGPKDQEVRAPRLSTEEALPQQASVISAAG